MSLFNEIKKIVSYDPTLKRRFERFIYDNNLEYDAWIFCEYIFLDYGNSNLCDSNIDSNLNLAITLTSLKKELLLHSLLIKYRNLLSRIRNIRDMDDDDISGIDMNFVFSNQYNMFTLYEHDTKIRKVLDILSDCSNVADSILYTHCKGILPFAYNKNTLNVNWKDKISTIKFILTFCSDYLLDYIIENKSLFYEEKQKREEREKRDTFIKNLYERKELEEKINLIKTLKQNNPHGFKKYFPYLSLDTLTLKQANDIILRKNEIKSYQYLTENPYSVLSQSVSSLEKFNGIPYYHFYYYYPTSIPNVTPNAQWVRRQIWDFKDGKRTFSLEVIQKLQSFFKPYELNFLTFACLPASNDYSTKIRYESFSNEICSKLGMQNALPYVKVKSSTGAKHLGNSGIKEYEIDYFYFRNKNVIVFDDIVTSGLTMMNFVNELKNKGANIICIISLGKTISSNIKLIHPALGKE